MKKILPFIFAIICFVSFVNAQDLQTEETQPFTVTLTPDKEEIVAGEPVFLSLEFNSSLPIATNTSADIDNKELSNSDKYLKFYHSYNCSVFEVKNGELVKPTKPKKVFAEFPTYLSGIKEKNSLKSRILFASKVPTIETIEYQVDVNLSVEIKINPKKINPNLSFKERLKIEKYFNLKVSARIKVLPENDIELGNIINELGSNLNTYLDNPNFETEYKQYDETYVKTNEIIEVFNYLEDKRTMPYLIKLFGFIKAFIYSGLTPEKLLDIVKECESKEVQDYAFSYFHHPSQYVKYGSMYFLIKSDEPSILEMLSECVYDQNMMIRAYAMEALFKLRTKKAIKRLNELSKEKDIYISTLAKEYLKQIEKDKLKITQ